MSVEVVAATPDVGTVHGKNLPLVRRKISFFTYQEGSYGAPIAQRHDKKRGHNECLGEGPSPTPKNLLMVRDSSRARGRKIFNHTALSRQTEPIQPIPFQLDSTM
jgi:hypothetical protein